MLLRLLIFILFAATALGQTPTGYQKWHMGGDEYRMQFGGVVANYQTGGDTWAPIDNHWTLEGDSVVFCNTAALKTRVNKQGQSTITLTHDGVDYVVSQKLLGIGWINTATHGSLWIDSAMTWNTPIVSDGAIDWIGVSPGVDYNITKLNGQVPHQITFSPAFLDSAVTLYNQRSDSLDIALANVMTYTISVTCDNYDVEIGDVPRRVLKHIGSMVFQMSGQQVSFPGSDTLAPVKVRQYWEKRGSQIICLEYVKMRALKQIHTTYPMSDISHNASFEINESTTLVRNTDIYEFIPNENDGAYVIFVLGVGVGVTRHFRAFCYFESVIDTMRVVGAATWDSALFKFTVQSSSGLDPGSTPGTDDDTLGVTIHKMNADWCEGTGTNWDPVAGVQWDSAYALDGDSACGAPGVDWTDGGAGWDATAEGRGGTPDTMFLIGDNPPAAQDTMTMFVTGATISDTTDMYGWAIDYAVLHDGDDGGTDVQVSFWSDDNATAGRRPRIIVYYTTGAAADISYVRRIKEGEGK